MESYREIKKLMNFTCTETRRIARVNCVEECMEGKHYKGRPRD